MDAQAVPHTYDTGFDRDARKIGRRNPKFPGQFAQILVALKEDPYNMNRKCDIKKLGAVKPGQGQWRFRFGNYRLRYDIFRRDVVLYSVRHRREAY